LSRFFNRPVVLLLVLVACIGILIWKFWPLNQDELYQRGAKLMESDSLYDMKQAWTEYLEPLERDYPDHPYHEEVAAFRLKWDAAKAPHPSEAQLFFQQGELLQKQGNPAAAQQVWRNLIDVFAEVDAEKEWVNRATRALTDLERAGLNKDRWKNVRTALDRAKGLQQQGKLDDAERIWRGIQELYRNDPAAANILLEIQRTRQKK
jgi:eukaryotic-like serine/threonine-protein kinase